MRCYFSICMSTTRTIFVYLHMMANHYHKRRESRIGSIYSCKVRCRALITRDRREHSIEELFAYELNVVHN